VSIRSSAVFGKITRMQSRLKRDAMNLDFLGGVQKQIDVYDPITKQLVREKVYGEELMKLFYGQPILAKFTSKVLTQKWLSNVYGAYNDSAASKHKIEDFVKYLGIDVSEAEKEVPDYHSFNDFFARKLKSHLRPIDADPNGVASPGDGRLLVFPEIQTNSIVHIKWAPISLLELFNGNKKCEETYSNGSCFILRLCPADYHRFHFPVAGTVGITKTVPGMLHSVNPVALEKQIPVFCLNKRTLCELNSALFGNVLLMEVGAMFVGSIVQTYRAGMTVAKGDEKGYFKFGGSTVVVFFEKNKIEFDPEIVEKSAQGVETLLKMGQRIARLKSASERSSSPH
jgi:phosphatidylserine decarboxylase